MPTIKEIADAEAERAEAEADDETDETDETAADPADDDEDQADLADDPDPEPGPVTEAQLDRAAGEVERAGDAYTEHVRAIQHETPLGLVECPLCLLPGFVSEVPLTDIDPMQRLAVLTVMGEAQGSAAPAHPNLHRCEACDGWGLLDTGSRREAFATSPCPRCGGNGYQDEVAAQAMADARAATQLPAGFDQTPAPAPTNNVIPTPTVTQGGHTFALIMGGAPDQVGRLAGHPLWGQPVEVGGL